MPDPVCTKQRSRSRSVRGPASAIGREEIRARTGRLKWDMKRFPVFVAVLGMMSMAVPLRGQAPAKTPDAPKAKEAQANAPFHIETVCESLDVPWAIVWAPDGRMIFTERPGRVRV